MISRSLLIATLTGMALTACVEGAALAPDLAALREPEIIRADSALAPPGAAPGTCWGRDVSPAVIETVTEQVMVQPPEVLADGTVLSPAIYRSETHQRIVQERRETWFETPCENIWTNEFTASLQRALKVRGHYYGAITGQRDKRTRAAIRRYQKDQDLNSAILSVEAARQLGLIAVRRDDS